MSNDLRLRPSSAAIWAGARCTMHPHMVAKYGGGALDTSAAEEGTAAHWLAENILTDATRDFSDYIGTPAPNGVMVTEEMAEAVEVYVDYVESRPALPNIEQRVKVFNGCSGTPDCWVYDAETQTLEVIDYKHGMGIVDPFENWQLALYAAGIAQYIVPGVARVKLTVVQPRAYSREGTIRTWECPVATARGMWLTATTRAIEAQGSPIARSGTHCKYCPGRHACPAAVTAGVDLYEAATSAAPLDMSAAEMGLQMGLLSRAHEQLEHLITAYEEQIKSQLYAGAKIDGWALEEKAGRESWAVSDDQVKALGELFNVDICPPKPLTPKQAIKKGIDTRVINAYTTQTSSGHKLKAVNSNFAKRIFSQ